MSEEPTQQHLPLAGLNIVLGVTGSIAAYKAALCVRELQRSGARVDVCLSRNAEQFIGAETFRGLTARAPYAKAYQSDMSLGAEPHVTLGTEADAMLIAPATASTLSRLANGPADEPVSLTALNTKKPLFVAPAMSSAMWEHPQTKAVCDTLRERGVQFIGPVVGDLASGAYGIGRMADPEVLVGELKAHFGKLHGDLRGRKVVVTAGGTRERIDPVRYIGNDSSGKMGIAIAAAARDRGADVTLISSSPIQTPAAVEAIKVESAEEMLEALQSSSVEADLLVMAAAVADYKPQTQFSQKLKKGDTPCLEINLEQNPDLISAIKQDGLVKVAFAAETSDVLENAKKKITKKGAKFIVANDISKGTFGSNYNSVSFVYPDRDAETLPKMTKYDVGWEIIDRTQPFLRAGC